MNAEVPVEVVDFDRMPLIVLLDEDGRSTLASNGMLTQTEAGAILHDIATWLEEQGAKAGDGPISDWVRLMLDSGLEERPSS